MPPQDYYQRPPMRQRNGMTGAAVLMAVLAVFSFVTVVGPMFFGSLAVIFAILSKGGKPRMQGSALGSSIVGGGGALLSLVLTVMLVWRFTTDPNMKKELDNAFQMMYGVDYDGFREGMQKYYETGEIPDFMEQYYRDNGLMRPGEGEL